jgi:6-phosphogluconolactonase
MKRYALPTAFAILILPAVYSAPIVSRQSKQPKPPIIWVYVGTYTDGLSKGIYRLELNLATGKLGPPAVAGASVNPSFLAIHPGRRFLYAVNEIGNYQKKKAGAVSAFTIDSMTGDLKLLNQQSSGGADPCHLAVDRLGKHVLAANYSGGSVCVLPIGENGWLGEATAFEQHRGSSVNKQRQEAPHAHSVNLDPANQFAFVADLGLDKVMIYRYGIDTGTLTPKEPPSVSVKPGAGPRHFVFHPNGRFAYVINELDSTVTVFDYDSDKGALNEKQTLTTLPESYKGRNGTAEVVLHPSGRFLYGSNRGHDSLAIFTVDQKTGMLTPAGHQDTRIKTPRNFAIDPGGNFLLVANQSSDKISVFRINQQTGELTFTGNEARVPRPVCLRMMPRLPKP